MRLKLLLGTEVEEGSSVMFAFRSPEARDGALRALTSQPTAPDAGEGLEV